MLTLEYLDLREVLPGPLDPDASFEEYNYF